MCIMSCPGGASLSTANYINSMILAYGIKKRIRLARPIRGLSVGASLWHRHKRHFFMIERALPCETDKEKRASCFQKAR
jgi:hypothetical protein